jgi:acetyltransferase-like isoleucine patch superfamily enzyme
MAVSESRPLDARQVEAAQAQLFDARVGAREKYQRLVVGRTGWGPLLAYELVNLFTQWVPGALGLALRKRCYPWLLGACGRGVVFGQHVTLRHPHRIFIGDDVVVDDHCLLDAKGEGHDGIRIGSGVFIGRNTILSCKSGDIVLGDGANIGFNCEIFSASRVTLGPKTLVAAYCYLGAGTHDMDDPSRPVIEQARVSRGIALGEGVWLGAGANILDGVSLGDHAIVGSGAVVRENVAAGDIVAGVPARVVGTRDGRAARVGTQG